MSLPQGEERGRGQRERCAGGRLAPGVRDTRARTHWRRTAQTTHCKRGGGADDDDDDGTTPLVRKRKSLTSTGNASADCQSSSVPQLGKWEAVGKAVWSYPRPGMALEKSNPLSLSLCVCESVSLSSLSFSPQHRSHGSKGLLAPPYLTNNESPYRGIRSQPAALRSAGAADCHTTYDANGVSPRGRSVGGLFPSSEEEVLLTSWVFCLHHPLH